MLDTGTSPIKSTRPRRSRTLRTHSRRLSEIETLACRECVLLEENIALANAADELSAQNLFRGHIDAQLQKVNEQLDAVGELLTHQAPETVREMCFMLEVLAEQARQMAGATDEQAREARLAKVERIADAIRLALPDVPFLDHEQHGFAMSRETRALLNRVASAKSGPAAVEIAEPITEKIAALGLAEKIAA